MSTESQKRLKSFIQKKDFSESPGIISAALPYNMGAGKRQPSLFDELEEKHQLKLKQSDETYLIDRQGKRVVVSGLEKRVVYALGIYISQYLHDDELLSMVKDNDTNSALTHKEFPINIKELANFIFHRSKTEQQEKIRNLLGTLADKRQVMEFFTADNKKRVVIESPLIKCEESILVENLEETDENRIERNTVNLSFGRIFFWNLHKRYAYFPVRLFEIWHKKGSGTESNLFDVLLETLLYHHWHCVTAYKSAEQQLKEELKANNQKLPPEQYKKELYKRRETALTYKESLSSILDRVDTQYNYHRHAGRLDSDLQKAVNVLMGEHVNIISDFRKDVTPSDVYLYFKYNINYGKNELPFTEPISSIENNTQQPSSSEDSKRANDGAERANDEVKLVINMTSQAQKVCF